MKFTLNNDNTLEVVTFFKDLWLKTVNSFKKQNFRNNKELWARMVLM